MATEPTGKGRGVSIHKKDARGKRAARARVNRLITRETSKNVEKAMLTRERGGAYSPAQFRRIAGA